MPSERDTAAVRKRANGRCEYCHAPEEVAGYTFHIEHINPRSKGGPDELENYALSCVHCNISKSNHVTGLDPLTGTDHRLFHPRKDNWSNHFQMRKQIQIGGRTEIGRATEQRLKLNAPSQLEARELWAQLGLYL